MSTYKWLICYLLKQTYEKYESLLAQGFTKFQAKNKSQVYRWRNLTKAYAEYLALMFSLEAIQKKEEALQPVLNRLVMLYGLWSLDGHLTELYEGGYCTGPAAAQLLRAALLELCGELKGDVVGVVDALAPTDFVLNSVLGNSDGRVSIFFYIFFSRLNL